MRLMASSDRGAQVQSCPRCSQEVATAGLEPFGKVDCPACGETLRVERTFENFVVVEPLGTGGMGSVYKARDTRLNRFVALKLLRKEFAGDAAFTVKLQEEARITASIKHPHVVEVYSVGEDHGQFYVVMELVDGGSLDDRMEDEKRISEAQTLELGLQVAQGLQAALKAGLIHRDIKPGNILFADRNRATIVDFGLALLAAQHAETEGEIWGTPYYVAPERLTGAKEDFRSDLYSLGATLFHAISGHPTFENETQSAGELRKLKSNPTPLQKVAPDVSDETAAMIDRMLQPDPADRQTSYQELISELQAAHAAGVAREEKKRTRWSWPVRLAVSLGALALLVALGFGAVYGWRHLPRRSDAHLLAGESAGASTGVADDAQMETARRELEAGHYSTAEALFRELAVSQPNVRPAAEFCAGLQLWERGQFAQAVTILQRFVEYEPAAPLAWMKKFIPLARDRRHDYQLFGEWDRARSAIKDPAIALKRIREVQQQLKVKGALAFQLADEEAKLAARVSDLKEKQAAEEKALASEETPRLRSAIAAAQKLMATYQFKEAEAVLQKTVVKSAAVGAEQERELQRASWLAEWKTRFIRDLNETGYGGAVVDVHGVRYEGPIRRATAEKLALRTRYGTIMTYWLNIPPGTLLTMSRAFIRPQQGDVPERQWLCAHFAFQIGDRTAANELASQAAAGQARYRELLGSFFPEAKK